MYLCPLGLFPTDHVCIFAPCQRVADQNTVASPRLATNVHTLHLVLILTATVTVTIAVPVAVVKHQSSQSIEQNGDQVCATQVSSLQSSFAQSITNVFFGL